MLLFGFNEKCFYLMLTDVNSLNNESRQPTNNTDENVVQQLSASMDSNPENSLPIINEEADSLDYDVLSPSSGHGDADVTSEENMEDNGGRGSGWDMSASSGDEREKQVVSNEIVTLYDVYVSANRLKEASAAHDALILKYINQRNK
ncbi:uncharacterized protein ACNLHF_022716 [Anomaloglossus baeobatrachus]